MRLKTQKMHVIFYPHKCYSFKQISIAVRKNFFFPGAICLGAGLASWLRLATTYFVFVCLTLPVIVLISVCDCEGLMHLESSYIGKLQVYCTIIHYTVHMAADRIRRLYMQTVTHRDRLQKHRAMMQWCNHSESRSNLMKKTRWMNSLDGSQDLQSPPTETNYETLTDEIAQTVNTQEITETDYMIDPYFAPIYLYLKKWRATCR